MKRTGIAVLRLVTVCLLVLVSGLVASLLPDRGTQMSRASGLREMTDRKMPPAIAKHMKRLQSIPGLDGMHPDGPSSAGEESFLAMAYPDTDIPLARLEAARSAPPRATRTRRSPQARAARAPG